MSRSIERLIVDVSGEPYIDLETEAVALSYATAGTWLLRKPNNRRQKWSPASPRVAPATAVEPTAGV